MLHSGIAEEPDQPLLICQKDNVYHSMNQTFRTISELKTNSFTSGVSGWKLLYRNTMTETTGRMSPGTVPGHTAYATR
jgi:hypothetical protein